MNYLERHEKKENWNDYMSAGSLSRWILWNKVSLNESIKDYMRKFKLGNYLGLFYDANKSSENNYLA
jgi:hypothetical protein